MKSTIPRTYIRLADQHYPVPEWHAPSLATHAEVFAEDPPAVPDGRIAELAEQPELVDGVWLLRYTLRDLTAEEQAARLHAYREGLSCSAVQGVKALEAMGHGAMWDAWRESEDRARRAFAIYSTRWARLHPEIIAAGQENGFSDAELDQLFELARGLAD